MELRQKFSYHQYGFRENRSTIQALESALQVIDANRADSRHTLLVALDLKNAFNSAWHEAIAYQLRKLGCNKQLGELATNFLKGRKIIGDQASIWAERGCPQGSSSGPILWLLLMETWFQDMLAVPMDDG